MKDGNGKLQGIAVVVLLIVAFLVFRGGGASSGALGRLLLRGIGIVAVGIVILVILVVYLALRSSKKDKKNDASKEQNSLKEEEKTILVNGRRDLLSLKQLTMRIKNQEIRKQSSVICDEADKIMNVLKEKPDQVRKARQFLNYYLPTLGTILRKYNQMELGGMADEEMTKKVKDYLNDIETATKKQYSNLFEADILDLTVEMEVMTKACERDGLLEDKNSIIK